MASPSLQCLGGGARGGPGGVSASGGGGPSHSSSSMSPPPPARGSGGGSSWSRALRSAYAFWVEKYATFEQAERLTYKNESLGVVQLCLHVGAVFYILYAVFVQQLYLDTQVPNGNIRFIRSGLGSEDGVVVNGTGQRYCDDSARLLWNARVPSQAFSACRVWDAIDAIVPAETGTGVLWTTLVQLQYQYCIKARPGRGKGKARMEASRIYLGARPAGPSLPLTLSLRLSLLTRPNRAPPSLGPLSKRELKHDERHARPAKTEMFYFAVHQLHGGGAPTLQPLLR